MLLVSCASDVKLHECANYELAHVYRPLNSSAVIQNVSWCKDGSWLAVVPNQGNAEIIRTKDDVKLLQSILGVAQPTSAVFQRTTKKNVAMSTKNGGILVYDIKARNIKKKFANSGTSTSLLDWNMKDTHLAAGGLDGQVSLYSNTTNQRTSVLMLPASKSVSVVKFHRTQRQLLGSASDEGVVVVWDINNGKKKFMMQSHKAPVTDLVFSPQNHNLLTSVGLDRMFQCYDTNNGSLALTVQTDHPLSALDMAPDGHTVAVASTRGNIYVYDLREHREPLKTISAHVGEIKRVLYQPQTTDNYESVNISEDKSVEVEAEHTSTDSFAQLLNHHTEFSPRMQINDYEAESQKRSTSVSNSGDSFFADMVLDGIQRETDGLKELPALGISDGVKKWIDTKSQSNLDLSLQSKTTEMNTLKPTSSTPLQHTRFSCGTNDIKHELSPFVMNTPIPTKGEIQTIVKSEVKEAMSDLTDYLNRHFLSLQMYFCKQSVTQEQQFEKLIMSTQGELNANLLLENQQLQDENEFLKNKINNLFREKH